MSSAPLIATPDYMRTRAKAIHNEVLRQSSFLSRLASDQRAEWKAFRDRWVAWYSAGPNWYWGATNETLDDWTRELAAWGDVFVAAGARAAVRAPTVPQTTPERLNDALKDAFASPITWIGIGAVLYLASKD